ncbi:type II toxin-antitoxin system HicB family antitoxin [Candidatus Poribacteria bacterium]|nr:type II toxin-antitoxin system HicB family antitoxin [Candidatus Poribacteria bacterium]MYG07339.1 type II toxin-antitoxin system HicB family antitoxin [Candidatus Poribacteria bacterium]MYK22824.1 type II toxin-antitoxin system HicB family antitoxin [Candidatus Poribacteria bacterium]
MKTQTFTASISQEGELFIAQCLEIDVASQGKSEDDAINNLKEALELYLEPPRATVMPKLRKFEISINSDETAFLSSD